MSDQLPNPDLQSILANLAHYTPPVQHGQPKIDVEKTSRSPDFNETSHSQHNLTPVLQASSERVNDPRLRPQSRSNGSPKPMIDPATITTWQEGLRCVTKVAAQNAQFAITIRRMIEDQRRTEMRWYAERQALKQKQTDRSQSSAEAQLILQSLSNASGVTSDLKSKTVDTETELANFDAKIYSAQLGMESSMTAELKALGVPFFGTDESLVVEDPEKNSDDKTSTGRPKWSPIINRVQLLELRRRMVGHLEDLYRD